MTGIDFGSDVADASKFFERAKSLSPLSDWEDIGEGDDRGRRIQQLQGYLTIPGLPWPVADAMLRTAGQMFKDPLNKDDEKRHLRQARKYYRERVRPEDIPEPEVLTSTDLWIDVTEMTPDIECVVEVEELIGQGKRGIIPKGTLSVLVGDRGLGKSYLALWICAQAIKKHKMRVLWMDHEIGRTLWIHKVQSFPEVLKAMSKKNRRVAYSTGPVDPYESPITFDDSWLIVYDSATSWGCPQDGRSPQEFFAKCIDPFMNHGCTVLMIDHRSYTDNREMKSMVGAGAKDQKVQGTIIGVRASRTFGKRQAGRLELICEKDNAGTTRTRPGGQIFSLAIDSSMNWVPEAANIESGEPVRETYKDPKRLSEVWHEAKRLMETRGVEWLSKTDMRTCCQGAKKTRTNTLVQLELSNMITVDASSTPHEVRLNPPEDWEYYDVEPDSDREENDESADE